MKKTEKGYTYTFCYFGDISQAPEGKEGEESSADTVIIGYFKDWGQLAVGKPHTGEGKGDSPQRELQRRRRYKITNNRKIDKMLAPYFRLIHAAWDNIRDPVYVDDTHNTLLQWLILNYDVVDYYGGGMIGLEGCTESLNWLINTVFGQIKKVACLYFILHILYFIFVYVYV